MQHWFNDLSNAQSSMLTILSILVGAYFFHLRITDQIWFGYFFSLGIFMEALILNFKKYTTSDVAYDHEKK